MTIEEAIDRAWYVAECCEDRDDEEGKLDAEAVGLLIAIVKKHTGAP